MATKVEMTFKPDAILVPIDKIVPLRKVPGDIHKFERYSRILASLKEVGLIEPLILFPQKSVDGSYLLLDGTLRLHGLRTLGYTEVLCLVATEDETYTYNQKVNLMTPIQEHFMILKAIKAGVPEGRIAGTLNINVARVREKQNLLAGICPEAIELIKDKRIPSASLREMKRVIPIRQVEMAELMVSMNNFSLPFAKCLYGGTSDDQKLESERHKEQRCGPGADSVAMNSELENLTRAFKAVHESHGENVLNLVPLVGYLRTLLANSRVFKFLNQRHPDIVAGLQKIVQAPELDAA
jgi:hypothetical protein